MKLAWFEVMGAISPHAGGSRPDPGPQVRPWQLGDLQLLEGSESLYSADTCSRRFLTGQQRLPAHYLAGLRQMEAAGGGWIAQVAVDRNRLVAVAECAWDQRRAEPPDVAIVVADAWQGMGLGRRTLRELIRRCRESGLTSFSAEYLQSNPIVRLLAASLVDEMGPSWSIRIVPGTGTHRLFVSGGR